VKKTREARRGATKVPTPWTAKPRLRKNFAVSWWTQMERKLKQIKQAGLGFDKVDGSHGFLQSQDRQTGANNLLKVRDKQHFKLLRVN